MKTLLNSPYSWIHVAHSSQLPMQRRHAIPSSTAIHMSAPKWWPWLVSLSAVLLAAVLPWVMIRWTQPRHPELYMLGGFIIMLALLWGYGSSARRQRQLATIQLRNLGQEVLIFDEFIAVSIGELSRSRFNQKLLREYRLGRFLRTLNGDYIIIRFRDCYEYSVSEGRIRFIPHSLGLEPFEIELASLAELDFVLRTRLKTSAALS